MFRSLCTPALLVAGLLILIPPEIPGGDWKQWRGPLGNNTAEPGQKLPVEWSDSRNVVWKVPVPGRGHSSPIVFGNLVVLCSADEKTQTQAVLAFDRRTGKPLWLTPVSQGGFPTLHPKNTHASTTAATDGQRIYAAFNHHEKIEVVALDLNGKVLWRTDAGRFRPQAYEYGYASSPTIFNDTLIISADCDTGAWLRAFRLSDGGQVWSRERPLSLNWGSPIVARFGNRQQLLLSGTSMIAAYNPADGTPLWNTPCLTMATCGTCIWDEDTVFASGGYPESETAAVKADGSGVVWKNKVKCYEQSMLITKGHIYAFSDQGVFYCWNAKTGEERWKQRLKGPVSTSPLLIDDVILATNEAGTTWAIRADPERYELVAQNQLGDSGFATMAAADGRLYIRTSKGDGPTRQETLYCIGSR
ncbi:MAG: PQQ-binding-like beta-propeller repeat protein [Planctomycetota bacterium]